MNVYLLQCFSLASVDQVLFAYDQYGCNWGPVVACLVFNSFLIGDQWLFSWYWI